ncbi:hypothetical protein R50073_12920 [Maricurvus nonylphenolicus]|uniref:glutathione S-transferase family protein n=1 Tax=Maricurvus nonylphenolicus TaxID=1008307 RepID=UPI0036F2ACA0
MKLFGVYLSPFSVRIMMQLDRKGIGYDLIMPPGGLHSDEYGEINYMQRVPTLELDNGERMFESGVMAEYIESAFPGDSLIGSTPLEASRIRLVMRLADLYLLHAFLPIVDELSEGRVDSDVVNKCMAHGMRGLKDIDNTMQHYNFEAKNDVDLADCTLVPALTAMEALMVAFGRQDFLSDFPKVNEYWSDIQNYDFPSFYVAKAREAIKFRQETGGSM